MTQPGPRPLPSDRHYEPCTCLWEPIATHQIGEDTVTSWALTLVDPDCPSHLPDPD